MSTHTPILFSNTTNESNLGKTLPVIEDISKKRIYIQKAAEDYNLALYEYIKLHPSLPDNATYCLRFPYNNFIYYNNQLHFILNKSFPLEANIHDTFDSFFRLPCSDDCVIETRIINCLSNLFKTFNAFPKYQTLLFMYEERFQHFFPLQYFFLMNGTLCYYFADTTATRQYFVLTSSNFDNLFLAKYRSTILSLLKSLKHSDVLLNFCHKKTKNPYHMHLNGQASFFSLEYNVEKRTFDLITPEIQIIDDIWYPKNTTRISHLFQYTICKPQIWKNLKITSSLVHLLHTLVHGDYQVFINFCILLANIASPNLITPKLFLVTYSNEENNSDTSINFKKLLESIFANSPDPTRFNSFCSYDTIAKLVLKNNLPNLCNSYLANSKAIVISHGSCRLSDTQVHTLKQYLKGSKVQTKDAKLGSIYYKNTFPIICFSDNHRETLFLEQNFPCVKINLDNVQLLDTDITTLNRNEIDLEWMRICLPLYGLYLLAEKNFYKVPLPKVKKLPSTIKSDTIINNFLHSCCRLTKDDFVYADELYHAYVEYYQTIHRSIPLKRTQFVSVLKRSGIVYKRPHTSKNAPNKYAFLGISLKNNWKDEIRTKPYSLTLDEEDFKAKLQEIENLVLSECKNYPFPESEITVQIYRE